KNNKVSSQTADGQDGATGTFQEVTFSRTIACNPKMAKGKIVLKRVFGVQAPKPMGNIEGHRPSVAFSIGQSDVTGDSGNMSVQRNHQTFRLEPVPNAAIDSIVRTNHPS